MNITNDGRVRIWYNGKWKKDAVTSQIKKNVTNKVYFSECCVKYKTFFKVIVSACHSVMWRTHSKYPWCWGNIMIQIKFDSLLSIPFLNKRLYVNYFFESGNVISRISKTSFINAFDITKLIHHYDTKVCYLRKEKKFHNCILDYQRKWPILYYDSSKCHNRT